MTHLLILSFIISPTLANNIEALGLQKKRIRKNSETKQTRRLAERSTDSKHSELAKAQSVIAEKPAGGVAVSE